LRHDPIEKSKDCDVGLVGVSPIKCWWGYAEDGCTLAEAWFIIRAEGRLYRVKAAGHVCGSCLDCFRGGEQGSLVDDEIDKDKEETVAEAEAMGVEVGVDGGLIVQVSGAGK
jgi:hypothetical protein